jgi:hypothetical protein
MDDLVLTPGGFRPRTSVHLIEAGHSLSGADNALRKLSPTGSVVADYGAMTSRPAGVPLQPNNVFVPRGRQVPGLGSGWITYAYRTNNTGHPISVFQSTWTVPPPPLTQSGQTIFLFNGIQNSTMIYQPVLQWGVSAAGGGNYWSIASWYVDGQGGPAFHSQLIPDSVGTELIGVMTMTGQQGNLFSYNCNFQGIPNSGYPIQNVEQLTWCIETLEAYSVQQCSDYPAVSHTAMTAIEIATTSGEAPLSWTAANPVTDCNQHTVIVSNASPGGEVDLFYRATQPGWEQIAGALSYVSAAADGSVWGVNSAGNIYQYVGGPSVWRQLPGALTVVSAGSAANIWGVNSAGNIYQYVGGSKVWNQIPGALSDISVAADGTMWGVNSAGNIYKYVGGSAVWQQYPGALRVVAAGSATNVWGVNSAGNIYKYVGGSAVWQQIPGGLSDISVASDGTVWGVNSAGNIYQYVGGSVVWQQVPGALSVISTGSSSIVWGVNRQGMIYRRVAVVA